MIKIKVCDVAPQGACAWYRGFGVLSKLRHIDSQIDIQLVESVNESTLLDTDILYMVRPVENVYITVMNMAKDFNVKVWIDYDDILHEIPLDNPNYEKFSTKERLDNITKAISLSDIVTVSTQEIKDYYNKIRADIVVIPNAHNDYNLPFMELNNESNVIYWRGSDTHREDLFSCKDQFIKMSDDNTDWKWYFIGQDPFFIARNMRKGSVFYKTPEPMPLYIKFMQQIKPEISVFPLIFSQFNTAKSNCVWLESTYFGASCVAPLLKEFCKPGIMTYKDPENFQYLTQKLQKSKSFRRERYLESYNYIKDNLLLSKVNKTRIEIIHDKVKI